MNSDVDPKDEADVDWKDPVFDQLLAESLGACEPPDLSDRVLKALASADLMASVEAPPVQIDSIYSRPARFETAARRETGNASDIIGLPKISSSPSAVSGKVEQPKRATVPMAIGLVSLAASIAVAILFFPGKHSGSINANSTSISNDSEGLGSVGDVTQLKADAQNSDQSDVGVGSPVSPQAIASQAETESQKKSEPKVVAPVTLGGPNFAGAPDANFESSNVGPQVIDFPRAGEGIADQEIVELINNRLAAAWNEQGISPANEVDVETLAYRLQQVAGIGDFSAQPFGQNASVSLQDWLTAIERGVRVNDVQTQLATRLAGSLLGRTGARRIKREQFTQFVKFLQPTVSGEKRYDEAVSEILTARGTVDPASEDFNPAAVWLGALAGPQSISLAEQAGHAFLNVDLKCGRCHDHPLDGRVWQDQYWQFSAMFDTGIQWQVEKSGALIVSSADGAKKQNVVFYEKVDGRQRAASPMAPPAWVTGASTQSVNPSGTNSGTHELERLAGSMRNNPQLAKAAVNLVWEAVYGRPLIGSVADPAAAPESPALNRLHTELAEQFRAHNYDMGRLFTWVIAAKPMQLDVPSNWKSPQFESASRADLAFAADQVRNFAGYPGAVPQKRFSDLLARVNVSDGVLANSLEAANNFPGGLLGQFQSSSDQKTSRRPKQKSDVPSDDQLLTASLEAVEHVPGASADSADGLPAEWLGQVGGPDAFQRRAEHLYYLAGYWHPSPQQLDVAKALREQTMDDSAALRRLWWVLANESL